ncbi:MAG: hypothetical protein ABIK83_13035 [Candidatus Zixiibacteriota bacterium]
MALFEMHEGVLAAESELGFFQKGSSLGLTRNQGEKQMQWVAVLMVLCAACSSKPDATAQMKAYVLAQTEKECISEIIRDSNSKMIPLSPILCSDSRNVPIEVYRLERMKGSFKFNGGAPGWRDEILSLRLIDVKPFPQDNDQTIYRVSMRIKRGNWREHDSTMRSEPNRSQYTGQMATLVGDVRFYGSPSETMVIVGDQPHLKQTSGLKLQSMDCDTFKIQ